MSNFKHGSPFVIAVQWVLAIAGICGLLCVAFWLGRWTAVTQELDPGTSRPAFSVADSRLAGHEAGPDVNKFAGMSATTSGRSTKGQNYLSDSQLAKALIALSETQPQSAMLQAEQLRGDLKAQTVSAILENWGAADPYAAWTWAEALQPQSNEKFLKLIEVIARKETQIAISYADKMVASHSELRKDVYVALFTGITQSGNYSVAAHYLDRLSIEPQIRSELVNLIASAWADYQPEAAMQWVTAQPESDKVAVMGRLGDTWVDHDPQAATQFAANWGGNAGESLLEKSFARWLEKDSLTAMNWLSASVKRSEFDHLYNDVSIQPSLIQAQPTVALQWAERISDSELRLGAITSVLSELKETDPARARNLLLNLSSLSPSQRAQIEENLALSN